MATRGKKRGRSSPKINHATFSNPSFTARKEIVRFHQFNTPELQHDCSTSVQKIELYNGLSAMIGWALSHGGGVRWRWRCSAVEFWCSRASAHGRVEVESRNFWEGRGWFRGWNGMHGRVVSGERGSSGNGLSEWCQVGVVDIDGGRIV